MNNSPRSEANAVYWNELCGTNTARILGLDDKTPASIEKFDKWFFDFYPYLIPFLESSLRSASEVLEVGLGYGSVATYLAKSGYSYTGLDIAEGPVSMCKQRLVESSLSGTAVQGDALLTPFDDNSFDAIIAIGSLHHTGDFDAAIAEMCRVVRPGGVVCGMVYSLFSARNFLLRPLTLVRVLLSHLRAPARVQADTKLRWMSDHNQKGEAAPATEYFSRKALHNVLEQYGDVKLRCTNLDPPSPFKFGNRLRLLLIRTPIASCFGLDLYFTLRIRPD